MLDRVGLPRAKEANSTDQHRIEEVIPKEVTRAHDNDVIVLLRRCETSSDSETSVSTSDDDIIDGIFEESFDGCGVCCQVEDGGGRC